MNTDQNLLQLERALRDAEQSTACRIHLVFQNTAPGYLLVSLVFAALMTVLLSIVLLFLNLNSSLSFGLQLVCFVGVFVGTYFTSLKHKVAPDFVKQNLAHYSLGQVLKRMNANPSKANVLVMVSQLETYAKVIPSQTVADQVPASVWTAIHNSLMIDVGHGEGQKGLKNSTSAISKLLKVYFPKSGSDSDARVKNRLEINA